MFDKNEIEKNEIDKNMFDKNLIESLVSAESSTNNTITIPWLGPIKLPWNLTTLSQEVKNFEKSPVRVLLKVSNSTTKFLVQIRWTVS